MSLAIMRELQRQVIEAVMWAETVHAVVRTSQSAACIVQARKLLTEIELLLVKEGANVDG